MREILKELKLMGKTIIISSHILPELAEMVDQIGVIEHGRMVAQGKVSDIQNRMRVKRVLHIRVMDRAEELAARLRDEAHVSQVFSDALGVHVQFSGGDVEQSLLLGNIIASGYQVVSYNEVQSNLEDVFLEITKGGAQV
ncbi:Daunorubicin/doxorubicin resistance ATP-binding protein DrrA [compost metagenome]